MLLMYVFPVVDTDKMATVFQTTNPDKLPISILIWTTTPWTLPANQAVTAGAEIEYILVSMSAG